MYDCGGYPGLVVDKRSGAAIHGEIWEVDSTLLCRLHSLEGVDQGLYQFQPISLEDAPENEEVFAYFYAKSIQEMRRIPQNWLQELDYGKRKSLK